MKFLTYLALVASSQAIRSAPSSTDQLLKETVGETEYNLIKNQEK
jgi:hypothetical protein